MKALVGKHKGKSMEELVLKQADYIDWIFGQSPSGPLLAMQVEAKGLVHKFDSKPFTARCLSSACGRPATRLSVYGNSISPYFWCDTCDPYEQGANQGKLQIFRTYGAALSHVGFFCSGRKSDVKDLIRDMAVAKGLPTRVGEAQALAFFA